MAICCTSLFMVGVDVTAVNVGEIAARLGQFPADSLAPMAAEAPAGGARG